MKTDERTAKSRATSAPDAEESIKVQTELDGGIKQAFELMKGTGASNSDLLRQGLVRLYEEYKISGQMVFKPLPGTA